MIVVVFEEDFIEYFVAKNQPSRDLLNYYKELGGSMARRVRSKACSLDKVDARDGLFCAACQRHRPQRHPDSCDDTRALCLIWRTIDKGSGATTQNPNRLGDRNLPWQPGNLADKTSDWPPPLAAIRLDAARWCYGEQ